MVLDVHLVLDVQPVTLSLDVDAVHSAGTILAMIANAVRTDVKKDTGDRPVIQIVALIVSTTHVLPQMEHVLKGVYQGTGETPVVRIALQIVTI